MRVLLFMLMVFVFVSPVRAADEGERKILYWVAPMDPDYRQDRPGKSPMGMDLVPVYEDQVSGNADTPENAVKISPVYRQALGVKTGKAAFHEFGKSIRAYGNIVPSARRTYQVDVRASGWIVDLAADAVGDKVKKGALLALPMVGGMVSTTILTLILIPVIYALVMRKGSHVESETRQ